MCGIVGYVGIAGRRPRHRRRPAEARVPRLRLRGRGGRATTASLEPAPLRGQAQEPRGQPAGGAAVGRLRHRPHPLGDPRPAQRGERPPAPGLHRARSSSSTTGSSRTTCALKSASGAQGHTFVTQTDTEVVAHLVESLLQGRRSRTRCDAPSASWRASTPSSSCTRTSPRRWSARAWARRSSSASARTSTSSPPTSRPCSPYTRDFLFLDDGDVVVVTPDSVTHHRRRRARPSTREPQRITWDPVQAEKGGYRHFMLKEIHEQPRAVRDTLLGPDRPRRGRGPPRGAGRGRGGAQAGASA